VNKALRYLLAGALLMTSPIFSDDTQGDVYGSESIKEQTKLTPFGFKANYDYIQDTRFERNNHEDEEHQRFRFALAQAELSAVFYYDACHQEGANVSLGYTNNLLDWKENPFFDQTDFNTVELNLGFFSKRLKNWFWQAQATINFDVDHWNFSDYTYYDLTLWGRYECSSHIGIHAGAIVQTGMKLDRVYPIFGFDWKFADKWTLNLVYPVNIALVYQYSDNWSFSAAGRFFSVRHRVAKDEQLSRGLIRYTNYGAEFMVKYETSENFWADIHAGYAGEANIRIANRQNDHAHHFHVKGAPYVGAELAVRF
jgi:hypothetical protein